MRASSVVVGVTVVAGDGCGVVASLEVDGPWGSTSGELGLTSSCVWSHCPFDYYHCKLLTECPGSRSLSDAMHITPADWSVNKHILPERLATYFDIPLAGL